MTAMVDFNCHLLPVESRSFAKSTSMVNIEVNDHSYFVGKRLSRRCVTATIYPQRQEVVIKYERRVHKRYAFQLPSASLRQSPREPSVDDQTVRDVMADITH